MARQAIERFSSDGGSTLSEKDFASMLGSRPWIQLLPRNIRDELIMDGAAARSESPARSRVKSSPAKEAFRIAMDLFEQADTDGNNQLDEEE